MTQAELLEIVEREIKSLSSKFESIDYVNAVNDACRETGWSFPVTDGFEILWIKRRTKRHLFYMLYTGNAAKFKVDQINLQQKFKHFGELVEKEDDAFEKIQESEPQKFANVDDVQMFGHKVDAGFSYDGVGQETTFDGDNIVIVTPSDTD